MRRDRLRAKKGNESRGLNENYGRELMECTTLGVNGGYTQQDVIEVARCLTGWTIRRPRYVAEFFLNPLMHDYISKLVLGHKFSAGRGMEDGLDVLNLLATIPQLQCLFPLNCAEGLLPIIPRRPSWTEQVLLSNRPAATSARLWRPY